MPRAFITWAAAMPELPAPMMQTFSAIAQESIRLAVQPNPGGEGSPAPSTNALFAGLVRARLDLLGELLELLREGSAEALDRSVDPVDAEFGGELVFFEQIAVGG